MKTIGVVIGSTDEGIEPKYFKQKKASLKFLEEYGYTLPHIPYDTAIFAEIKHQAKKMNVIPLFGDDYLSLDECKQCDVIFCIVEGTYSFSFGGKKQYNHYFRTLKKSKAQIIPSLEFQKFILQKHTYMKFLQKEGFQLAPTHYVRLPVKSVQPMIKFIEKNGYGQVILKPELGAFKQGFKKIDNPTVTKLTKLVAQFHKQGFQNLLLQPFVREFNYFGEIKTYWVGGKHVYSYNQKWDKNGEGYYAHQKDIEPSLHKECLQTAKKAIQSIEHAMKESLVHCRVDFACCLDIVKQCRVFFINEIEICPTIGSDNYEADGKGYALLANELLRKIGTQ
jgi:glutathione synthase/RimK-type ligase-like ATP-grasp enzyme